MGEENENVEVVEDDKQEVAAEPREQSDKPQDDKMYTKAEVDELINKQFAKWQTEQEEKQSEAEKIKRMNAEQKLQYEKEKQETRIAELEAELNRKELEATASTILQDKGLSATSDVLGFVVRADAEQTLEAITAFTELVEKMADDKVKETLKGKTPTRLEHTSVSGITKEKFDRMGYVEKTKLRQENPALYDQLKG